VLTFQHDHYRANGEKERTDVRNMYLFFIDADADYKEDGLMLDDHPLTEYLSVSLECPFGHFRAI
jgi:hypothetical protein